eukprot:CAMPEP_0204877010 /NCGR_PEP_ID=MMETSP1348-20121228/47955_1 /ASSEMBLY_ACC=CAM_ASM_000700 /TAXON_ID=215587 /ORGANISM="Aplanochytrium stocchinoi, Strain GSBS06" /LENGTH=236 /DNA_ID=CAMNT_0052033837 /DNA_START=603 /DNA_END=1313 /DNA_ORIENTATION=-
MKNLIARPDSTLQNTSTKLQESYHSDATTRAKSTSSTKLQESYHSDAIVGKMSNPNKTRERQDCATFLSQANSFATCWSSVIPWSTELKITLTQYYVHFSKALGLKTAMGKTLNKMDITYRCRSSVVLDKYDEHLLMCRRTRVHDAAVEEIFRMCNQANITAIIEPEGIMKNNRRPDLVVSNFQNNNKQLFLDFTTISALSTNMINNAYDVDTYVFLPLVMELRGCPVKGTANFIM